jgi:hypothetical protein
MSGDGQVKRIYVPLPDAEAQRVLLKNLLKGDDYALQGNITHSGGYEVLIFNPALRIALIKFVMLLGGFFCCGLDSCSLPIFLGSDLERVCLQN